MRGDGTTGGPRAHRGGGDIDAAAHGGVEAEGEEAEEEEEVLVVPDLDGSLFAVGESGEVVPLTEFTVQVCWLGAMGPNASLNASPNESPDASPNASPDAPGLEFASNSP